MEYARVVGLSTCITCRIVMIKFCYCDIYTVFFTREDLHPPVQLVK